MDGEQAQFDYLTSVDERIAFRKKLREAIVLNRNALAAHMNDDEKHQIEVVDSAFRSVLCNGTKCYYSTPITSGKRLLDYCDHLNIQTEEELTAFKQKRPEFYEHIIAPNVQESIAKAQQISQDNPGKIVIAPAVFEAKKLRWSQEQYMKLWLDLIDRDIHEIHCAKDYQYSNGAIQELTHAILMKLGFSRREDIEIFVDNQPLNICVYVNNLISAMKYLSSNSPCPPKVHYQELQLLYQAFSLMDDSDILAKYNSSNIVAFRHTKHKLIDYLYWYNSLGNE